LLVYYKKPITNKDQDIIPAIIQYVF